MKHVVFCQTFVADPSAVGDARGLVADLLAQEGFSDEVCFVAALLTSEVATNAVVHAGGDFEVAVSVDTGRARIAVEDGNSRLPQLAPTAPDATSGRGLKMMDAMASAWGAEPSDNGKVVWFELAAS